MITDACNHHHSYPPYAVIAAIFLLENELGAITQRYTTKTEDTVCQKNKNESAVNRLRIGVVS